jgi:hypothetical protein
MTDRFVTGSPDDCLEEDPDVRVRLVDQDPCHVLTFGGCGSKAACGGV